MDESQGRIEAAPGVEVRRTGQLRHDDVLGGTDDPPQSFVVSSHAAAIPGYEAACQEALSCSL